MWFQLSALNLVEVQIIFGLLLIVLAFVVMHLCYCAYGCTVRLITPGWGVNSEVDC